MTARELCPKGCGQIATIYGGHGHYRDRGDGICAACGRELGWHGGTACYCPLSTGMPAPLLAVAETAA